MNIDIAYLKSLPYLTIFDEPRKAKADTAYLTINGLCMSDHDRRGELRRRISQIYEEKKIVNKMTSAAFECATNIIPNSLISALSGRTKFTREMLSKFCVGMQVPLEVANELFCLDGYPLSDYNAQDMITRSALEQRASIDEYLECLCKYECAFVERKRLKP